jgi:hypothetical protein
MIKITGKQVTFADHSFYVIDVKLFGKPVFTHVRTIY